MDYLDSARYIFAYVRTIYYQLPPHRYTAAHCTGYSILAHFYVNIFFTRLKLTKLQQKNCLRGEGAQTKYTFLVLNLKKTNKVRLGADVETYQISHIHLPS
jgi:hypothetical protein